MPFDLVDTIIQQIFCSDSPNMQDNCNMALVYGIKKELHYVEIHIFHDIGGIH